MKVISQLADMGVPLAKPRVALSAASPRPPCGGLAGFPLRSLTRNAASTIRLCSIISFLSSCSVPGEAATKRCIEQFTVEENIVFFNVESYCQCVMPKLVEYCNTNGIDLDAELNNRRFFELLREHVALDQYVQECTKANPLEDLIRIVVLSEKMKQSLVRKY